MLKDLSGGLPDERETIVAQKPAEPFWAENLLFALYDPKCDLAFWLHLGSVPNDWDMWEDRVLAALPGDEGVLSMWAYHKTPQAKKPAGSNLAFKCVEPFRRWTVTFDGFATHTSYADMEKGIAPDLTRKRMTIDLDVEMQSPVWDAHTAAHSHGGRGEMSTQGWAKQHYQQLYRARGTVRVEDKTYDFDGAGWRDHSRGPRGGGGGEPWGGHVTSGSLFPSGRALIFSSYWRPDGKVTLEGASVLDRDGAFHPAEILTRPQLNGLILSGERVPVRLRWDGGEVAATITTEKSIYVSMMKKLAVGKDLDGPGLMYVLQWGKCEWDGETAITFFERSDPLNAQPTVSL